MVSTFIRTKLITFVIYLIDLSDLYVKIQNLTGNTQINPKLEINAGINAKY